MALNHYPTSAVAPRDATGVVYYARIRKSEHCVAAHGILPRDY
jgi:hypothetical protein